MTEYPPGSGSPSLTMAAWSPQALALDGSGNLYVANAGGNTVAVYDAKTATLERTISLGIDQASIYSPDSLTFGPDGYLYVADWSGFSYYGGVTVYDPKRKGVVRKILQDTIGPVALKFGP